MHPQMVIVLSALTMLLPLAFIRWLWGAKYGGRFTRFLRLLITACAVLFFYLAGTWGFYSYYLRFFIVALFIIAAFRAYARPIERDPVKDRATAIARFLVLILLVILNGLAILGHVPYGKPVELAFPLRGGVYYVIQGGSSRVTNPFHGLYKTINAIDIVKLNVWGNRAQGLFPSVLSRYAVFGETVHSPCAGKVFEAVDGLPDLAPHDIDMKNPAGNHVVIQCKGVNVLLAHMKKGSVTVRKGGRVKEGQPIGRVGNSGNTFEPHLHIHAVRSADWSLRGPSVPILFDGRLLTLNSLVRSVGE